MIVFQYVFLHALLLIVSFAYCLKLSKKCNVNYWLLAFIPIVTFTIEEGCRWGRHIDWCAYYYQYQDMINGYATSHEPFFRFVWGIFATLNLDYPYVISFCSFLLIYSLFFFFKPYRRYAYIFIPFLIVWVSPKAINLIRWYMAFSFLLIGFRYFLDKKKVPAFIFIILSLFTHYAIALLIVLFLAITLFNKPLCKPWIAIVISLCLVIFFDTSFMKNFVPIVESLSMIDRFSGYVENAEGWLTGEGQNATMDRKSLLVYIVTQVPFYCYILFGDKKVIGFGKERIIFYNLAVICLFLRSISSGLELLGRYSSALDPFLIFVAVNSWVYLRSKPLNKIRDCFALMIICFSIVVQMYRFCAPMERTEYMHYVWNQQINPNRLYDMYRQD